MKREIIIFVILINLLFSVWSEAIRNYEQIGVHKIKVGKEEGELGVDPRRAQVAAPTGPTTFALNNDTIYVCDYINGRINVYDSNWNFLNPIKDKAYDGIYYSTEIKLDDMGNILVFDHNKSLLKIDKTGKLLLKIPKNKYFSDNFFPYGDKILFYNSNNRDGEKIRFYDKNGEILDNVQALKIINNAEENTIVRASNIESNDILKNEIQKIIKKTDIVIDKAPLTDSFRDLRDYYQILKGAQLKDISNKSNNQKEIKDAAEFEFPKSSLMYPTYIGLDADGNSYWQREIKGSKPRKDIIIVCSPYGEILDAFYKNISWSEIAIAPNGDVYFLSYDKEWVYFHKVERVW